MNPHDPNGNQFRQPPSGNPAPPVPREMTQPQHPQQAGMTAVPINTMHTWNFHFKSEIDGRTYEGQFTCKKLSIMEISRLGVRKVQLNGGFHYNEDRPGYGVEPHIDNMNSMLAHLELAVIQAPVWFNPEVIYDPSLLRAIYGEVAKFENSFFRSQRSVPEPGQGSPDDRSGESQESGSAGRVAEVGGSQVQPSLDP